MIHAVDSLYDTGIPAGTVIKYDPECKDRGYNSEDCYIRICEPGFDDGPDRLAGTKIHEWEHQKQKNDSLWGPGNVPPDTSRRRASLEFNADEATLNADNGNKIKLSVDQKLEILIRKSEHLQHMLDALEAEWKNKSIGALPGGVVREEVTIINNSDNPQLFNCTIIDSLGWSIVPQIFTVPLYPEQESTFVVFVNVPPITEIGTINELFCYAQTEDDTSYDFTMINIVPAVQVVAEADTHGLRGQIIEVPFTVTNRGETPDNFHIAVTNPLDWPAESFFDIFLDIGADSSFSVPIAIPMDAPLWTTNLIACEATSLSNPMYHDKDWLGIRVDEVDVRPMFIQSPIGTYTSGSTVTPKVTVYNDGYVESFFDVYFEVISPITHHDSVINLMLPSEHLIDVEMVSMQLVGPGPYNIRYFTNAHMDANPYNDTINGTFMIEPAIHAGWNQRESLLTGVAGKHVKDGGALVACFFDPGSDPFDGMVSFRGNKSNEVYKYDVMAKGSWSLLESIPYGKKPTDTTKINKKKIGKGASLCWDGDSIVYATRGNGTKEFWSYNIYLNTWIPKAFVTVPKYLKGGTSIAYLNGKVYLLAGGQKKTDPNNFYVYDVNSNTWMTGESLVLGPNNKPFKDGSCITELNGDIYALKAGDKGNYFYKYDTALTTWTASDSMPLWDSLYGKYKKKLLVKDGAAMANDGSVIYMVKGGGTNVFWKYTPGAKGSWTRLDSVPRLNKKSVAKTGGALAYADDAIWFLKGNNTPEFWEYVLPAKSARASASTINAIMTASTNPIIRFFVKVAPNPLNRQSVIRFGVPNSGNVSIKLYNVTGQLSQTIASGYFNTGIYTSVLSTRHLAKGIYFLRYKDRTNQAEIKLIVQ